MKVSAPVIRHRATNHSRLTLLSSSLNWSPQCCLVAPCPHGEWVQCPRGNRVGLNHFASTGSVVRGRRWLKPATLNRRRRRRVATKGGRRPARADKEPKLEPSPAFRHRPSRTTIRHELPDIKDGI